MRKWNNGGGYVSDTAKIEPSVFVQIGSYVRGSPTVLGDSVITENSLILGTAKIVDSMVCGNSVVKGKAQVVGSIIRKGAVIDEIASIWNSKIIGTAVKRFSRVAQSTLKGGWCQGDVYDSKLENCKVLGKIVRNEKV